MVWIGRTRCFPFWQEFSKVRSSKFAIRSMNSRSLLCRDFPTYPNTSGLSLSFSKPHYASNDLSTLNFCSASCMTSLTLQFPSLIPSNLRNSHSKTLQNPTKCYANAEKPSDCVAPKDDYMECLHNTKEVSFLVFRCFELCENVVFALGWGGFSKSFRVSTTREVKALVADLRA